VLIGGNWHQFKSDGQSDGQSYVCGRQGEERLAPYLPYLYQRAQVLTKG